MEIPLPIGGLNQALAFSDQPAFTARRATNVRGRDPVTGRARLSKRAGMSKYCLTQVTTSKIARLVAAIYDARRTVYEAQDPEQVWGVDLKGSELATSARVGRQDNLVVIDGGHSIARYGSDGGLDWTVKLPVSDDKHIVNAVAYDDLGNVYAGVSSGGDPDTAKVWRFAPKNAGQAPALVWEYSPGGYTTRIQSAGNVLVLSVEVPESETGKVVQLQGALTSGPTLGWEKVVSYPLPAVALKANGDVLFTSPANATRGIDPRYPQFTEKTVDADVRDVLPNWQKRIWCDLDASKIEGLENNDPVTLWEDSSGNGRDVFASGISGETSPVFQPDAINGLPAVFFRGGNTTLGIKDSLVSGLNPSGDVTSAEQQRTPVPGYYGARWAQFIVLRPNLSPVGVTSTNRCVWSMDVEADGSGTDTPAFEDQQLWVNRGVDGLTAAGDASLGLLRGAISFVSRPAPAYEGASSGLSDGTINYPIHGYFDETSGGNDTGTILVTLVYDNGQDQGTDDATVAHCCLRINGKPLDRWVGSRTVSPGPFWLGRSFSDTGEAFRFFGHIARFLVIRDSDEAENGLLTMPLYPRTVGTLGGAGTSVAVAYDALSDTELEKIEGVLMHKYGISHLAPTGAATAPTLTGYGYGTYNPGNFPHPYYRLNGPPTLMEDGISQEYRLASPAALVGKLDGSRGQLQWVATSAGDNVPPQGVGGVGVDVAVSGDLVFAIGDALAGGTWPTTGYAGDLNHIRCIVDKNTKGQAGYSLLPADGAWVHSLGAGTIVSLDIHWDARSRIDVDPFANLYTPGSYTDSTVSATVWQGVRTTGTSNAIATIAEFQDTYAVVVQRDVPEYRIGDGPNDDFAETVVTNDQQARAEYVYLLGATATLGGEVFKYRLVDATVTAGGPRESTLLAFSGGGVYRVTTGGVNAPTGTGTLTNPVYTGTYVSAVQAFGKIYFTDGRRYYTYDPRLDVVSTWGTRLAGNIPPRCRLIELWNGRIVLARAYDDPHGWHMSAQGDPLDWDFFPVPQTQTMAVSSVSARAGAAPDMVNALIPYSDDLLVVGCEKSIWVLRGDPAAGGVFDQVSNDVGIAFGRAWCRDPEGVIYFFSTKGGVYKMSGSGDPISLTRAAIDREMVDLDLETYYVELAWNEEADGLHVLVFPYGSGGAAVNGWFLQRGPDGWFRDEFSEVASQPTAVYQYDADQPGETALLFGSQSGYVLKYDRDAKSDDGAAIESDVIWGPFAPKATRMRYRFMHPTFVLDPDQGGCNLRLYVNVEPADTQTPTWTDTLVPGRNATRPMRATGEYVWLGLSDSSAVTSWAVEGGAIEATPVGRSRERIP